MTFRSGGDNADPTKSIRFSELRQEVGFAGATGIEAAKPEAGESCVVTIITPTGQTECRFPCLSEPRRRP